MWMMRANLGFAGFGGRIGRCKKDANDAGDAQDAGSVVGCRAFMHASGPKAADAAGANGRFLKDTDFKLAIARFKADPETPSSYLTKGCKIRIFI